MEIKFINSKTNYAYIVTSIEYGDLRCNVTTYVNGHYDGEIRNNPVRLFKCKKTSRPVILLSGKKYYAENIKDDVKFNKILKSSEIK